MCIGILKTRKDLSKETHVNMDSFLEDGLLDASLAFSDSLSETKFGDRLSIPLLLLVVILYTSVSA